MDDGIGGAEGNAVTAKVTRFLVRVCRDFTIIVRKTADTSYDAYTAIVAFFFIDRHPVHKFPSFVFYQFPLNSGFLFSRKAMIPSA